MGLAFETVANSQFETFWSSNRTMAAGYSVRLREPLGMGVNVFHGTEAGDVGAGVTVRHHEPFV